jgi:hypothetical protein
MFSLCSGPPPLSALGRLGRPHQKDQMTEAEAPASACETPVSGRDTQTHLVQIRADGCRSHFLEPEEAEPVLRSQHHTPSPPTRRRPHHGQHGAHEHIEPHSHSQRSKLKTMPTTPCRRHRNVLICVRVCHAEQPEKSCDVCVAGRTGVIGNLRPTWAPACCHDPILS